MKTSMTARRFSAGLGLLLIGFTSATACRTTPGNSSTAPTPAISVAPGINSEYLKPDLNVTQWVERFEREGREIYDLRDRIVRESGVLPGMTVADVGAGTGLFTLLFARAVGQRGTVAAVDIVPDFLRHIEFEARNKGLSNIRTVLCTERSTELASNSVDLAFVCDAYHHFEYPGETLASIRSALRNRGRLILVEFQRKEGQSSDWILRHVRAGQRGFEGEIIHAGFHKVREASFLRDNYFVIFEKRGR